MRAWKAFFRGGGGVLAVIFLAALIMSRTVEPVSGVTLPLTETRDPQSLGRLLFEHLPKSITGAALQAWGMGGDPVLFAEISARYLEAARKAGQNIAVVAVAKSLNIQATTDGGLPVIIVNDDHSAYPRLHHELATRLLSGSRVVLLLPAHEASHRMQTSLVTNLERTLGIKIPTVIVTPMAFTEADEAKLSPGCAMVYTDDKGQVFDLGCAILKISRQQRLLKPRLDQPYVQIEKIDPREEVISIYRPAGYHSP